MHVVRNGGPIGRTVPTCCGAWDLLSERSGECVEAVDRAGAPDGGQRGASPQGRRVTSLTVSRGIDVHGHSSRPMTLRSVT